MSHAAAVAALAVCSAIFSSISDYLIRRFLGDPSPHWLRATFIVRFVIILAVSVIAYSLFGLAAGIVWCILMAALATLSEIDARTQLIPDWLVVVVGLLAAAPLVTSQAAIEVWIDRALGALLAAVILWTIAEIFQRTRGVAGLGLGDVKLAVAGGLWVGWTLVPQVLLVASLSGVVGALIVARGRNMRMRRLPFGPYLSLAIGLFSIRAQLDIV